MNTNGSSVVPKASFRHSAHGASRAPSGLSYAWAKPSFASFIWRSIAGLQRTSAVGRPEATSSRNRVFISPVLRSWYSTTRRGNSSAKSARRGAMMSRSVAA